MKAKVTINLLKVFVKVNFQFARLFRAARRFCSNVKIIEFRQNIFHIPVCISVKCSNSTKCSELNLISLFILLSKQKSLYKQNFLEYFSN